MPPIEIRPLGPHEEFLACVDLQRETWGRQFSEIVPAAILKVSQRIGGVTAGAFDADGRLLGFVFGITGVENGRLVHWSDMLAVRPEARDLGLGRRLKEYQREVCRQLGVSVIYWTYDPLVSKNAHLNFNKLGTRVVEYVPDMYGDTDSELHRGLGTDRLVVAWPVDEAGAAPARAGYANSVRVELRTVPVVNEMGANGASPSPERFSPPPPRLRIEIPLDILAVQAKSPELAPHWRAATRRAFLWCLEHGYDVTGFYRDDAAARGYYLLARDEFSPE